MNTINDLTNELVALNLEHALTMAYLRVTDVLIKCNELDYELYGKLREQINNEIKRLKLELITKAKAAA